MRVSIPKGFHAPVQKLMQQLQTNDPALAVNHIIGCWLAAGGCPGTTSPTASSSGQSSIALGDDFDSILEVSLES